MALRGDPGALKYTYRETSRFPKPPAAPARLMLPSQFDEVQPEQPLSLETAIVIDIIKAEILGTGSNQEDILATEESIEAYVDRHLRHAARLLALYHTSCGFPDRSIEEDVRQLRRLIDCESFPPDSKNEDAEATEQWGHSGAPQTQNAQELYTYAEAATLLALFRRRGTTEDQYGYDNHMRFGQAFARLARELSVDSNNGPDQGLTAGKNGDLKIGSGPVGTTRVVKLSLRRALGISPKPEESH